MQQLKQNERYIEKLEKEYSILKAQNGIEGINEKRLENILEQKNVKAKMEKIKLWEEEHTAYEASLNERYGELTARDKKTEIGKTKALKLS